MLPYGLLNKQVRLDKLAVLNRSQTGIAARLADIVEYLRIDNRTAQTSNLTGTLCKYITKLSTVDWKLHPGYWVSSYQYDKTQCYVPAIGATHPECFDALSARAERLVPKGEEKEKIYLLYDSLCTKSCDETYRERLNGYSPIELMDVRKFFPVQQPKKRKMSSCWYLSLHLGRRKIKAISRQSICWRCVMRYVHSLPCFRLMSWCIWRCIPLSFF